MIESIDPRSIERTTQKFMTIKKNLLYRITALSIPPLTTLTATPPTLTHSPCLNQSVSFALPSCARLFTPCSLRSMRLRFTS